MIGTMNESGEVRNFLFPFNKEEIQSWFDQYEEVIGHNFIDFDAVHLENIVGVSLAGLKVTDTLILSKLYNPQLEGGHSLRAWGDRLHFPKGKHVDFDKLTPEMVEYCTQDLRVTKKVYDVLTSKLASFGDTSIHLEHEVQKIITKQIQNGWELDQRKCLDLLATLKERRLEIEEEVHDKFIPLASYVKEIKPKYKKNGELSNVGLKFLGDNWECVTGPFSRIEFPEFNLGSRQQIGRYLQYFGWKPTNFTEKGHVIVDEAILSKVTGIPEAQLIAEYLLVQKRTAQIQSWLDAIERDGRVHGYVNTIGAVTGRMTHSSPNMSQVPASYSPYGSDCRSCWTVPKGRKLVGADASGIELRMLGHFLGNYDNGDYGREVVEGDIHTRTQTATGLPDRASAKRFTYCVLYGGGPAKIGEIVNGGAKEGAKLKKKFFSAIPAFKKLTDDLSRVIKKQGYITGILGHRIPIRSEHSGLNFLLQGSAGTLSNIWLLNSYKELIQMGFEHGWSKDFVLLMHVHDEIQLAVRDKKKADQIGQVLCKVAQTTGTQLKLRVPINAEYKLGGNWAECH